ncbi:MAG TPA: hypothetical protein VI011_24170 [Asanoa sp.]
MRLTWRDGVATGFVALGLTAYVEFVRVGHVLAIPDAKGVSAVIFLAGMAACVVGGGSPTSARPVRWTASTSWPASSVRLPCSPPPPRCSWEASCC